MLKFLYIEVIKGKPNKEETRLFTCWQGYNNKLRKPKLIIIASWIQWSTTAKLKNRLQDINRPNLYLRDVSEFLKQENYHILCMNAIK